ncbi:hypothetical protein WJ438_40380 [Streptomyces sp. GD-15H]|uniref:hypothetical protein n=1 Tax=Streptomyces sp. GD-15H TaxID=3129112 RepID=UPI0032488DD0
MSPKKVPPPIPVIGAAQKTGDQSREEQLRAWEDNQRRLREQQAAAAAPVPVPVPAPASPPAAAVVEEPPPAAPERASTVKAETPGYLPMPEFTEPDSADPAARLEFYARGILAVQYAARANHERAEQQKLIGLGLRLRAIKDEELHKSAGFDTFGDLVQDRFGFKKHQANNIIRVLGVVQALEDVTTQELKARPLGVLVPVLHDHGADAVRKTWVEASRHGNVTETALRDAANFLGFGPPKELEVSGEQRKPAGPKPAGGMLRESAAAVERLRVLAQKDPDRARREADELRKAVEQLVEELSPPAP